MLMCGVGINKGGERIGGKWRVVVAVIRQHTERGVLQTGEFVEGDVWLCVDGGYDDGID